MRAGASGSALHSFLEADRYCGIDYNASFIRAAELAVDHLGLGAKSPRFEVVDDFEVGRLGRRFDFALAFSVLNHCTVAQRAAFFSNVPAALVPGAKLYVTHASWFNAKSSGSPLLRHSRTLSSMDAPAFGKVWGDQEGLFPILEFTKNTEGDQ